MSKDVLSLLLYLETCAVDHGGLVNMRHMSAEDMTIAEAWNEKEFIGFGRVCMKDIKRHGYTHWVTLSDRAWKAAHRERLARAARMWKRRKWRTTAEFRTEDVADNDSSR